MDLKNLSPEEKLELVKLLEQKELITKERVLETIRLHPKQLAFHKSPARIRLFCGGNGVGKSFTVLHELVHIHLGTHPHRDVDQLKHGWIIMPDFKKVPDYLRELKKVCPPSKFPAEDRMGTPNIRRLVWPNGGTTTFYSHEQDPMALEGSSIDFALFDEPPPRSLYIATYRGLRNNPQHLVAMALTPISEPWLYTDIYQPGVNKENPDIEVFVASTFENRHNLSEAWLKQFESTLTEEEIKVRLYGEFASLQGRVFKEFSRATHVIRQKPWPRDWPVYLCVDPHTRKKSVAVWIGVTKDEELIVLDEKEEDDIISLGMTINELEKQRKYRVVKRIIDNSGSSRDWSGSTAVELLRTKCQLHMVPVTNEEKDVDESLFRIKQLLRLEELPDGRKEPKLYFMEHCKNTITEMELYGWHENRNSESRGTSERVKKVYDDHIDPIRYIVMTRPKHAFNYDVIQYSGGYSKSRGPTRQSTLKNKLFGE